MTALIAYVLWGVFPVYFKLVQSVPPTEVLAHRIVWAVPFGALILHVRKQWPEVRLAFATPRVLFWLFMAVVPYLLTFIQFRVPIFFAELHLLQIHLVEYGAAFECDVNGPIMTCAGSKFFPGDNVIGHRTDAAAPSSKQRG